MAGKEGGGGVGWVGGGGGGGGMVSHAHPHGILCTPISSRRLASHSMLPHPTPGATGASYPTSSSECSAETVGAHGLSGLDPSW